jgi:hypothetical protein
MDAAQINPGRVNDIPILSSCVQPEFSFGWISISLEIGNWIAHLNITSLRPLAPRGMDRERCRDSGNCVSV